MATITLQGKPIETMGELPAVGQTAPDFNLVKTDLTETNLQDYRGKNIILNIFPSLDTEICSASVKKFNDEIKKLSNTMVLCISADLPFAHSRFCTTNECHEIIALSNFRNRCFGEDYGVTITSGALRGLLSRSVVVIDESGKVVYTEQVPEIVNEPDYDKALEYL